MVSKVWHLICGRQIKAHSRKPGSVGLKAAKDCPELGRELPAKSSWWGWSATKGPLAADHEMLHHSTPSPIAMSKQSGGTAVTVATHSVNNRGTDGPEAHPAQSLKKAPITATTLAGPAPTFTGVDVNWTRSSC